MATTAQATRPIPFYVLMLNPLIGLIVRTGISVGPKMALITVRGRRTGVPHTTPVGLFEHDGRRYLFGTFGNTSWVRNVRAAGELVLTHGRQREAVAVSELTPQQSATVLQACLMPYLRNPATAPMLRSFYGVHRGSSSDEFARIAHEHPAFELHPMEDDRAR